MTPTYPDALGFLFFQTVFYIWKAQIIQMDINNLDRPLIMLEGSFLKLSENKDLVIKEFIL